MDSAPATSTLESPGLAWFNNAKFGVFIHWGIYAVNGKDASWSYFNHGQPWARPEHHSSPEEYFAQCERFTAAAYDPDTWADTFRRAGARYVVITTKHCDDFALWATQQKGGRNVVDHTPAARDLIAPYCAALRRAGIKIGLYYSHSGWGHAPGKSFPKPAAKYARTASS